MSSSDSEEVEIKIEYNETFEKDPLTEKNSKATESYNVDNELLPANIKENIKETDHLPEFQNDCENCTADAATYDKPYEDYSIEEHGEMTTEKEATWYKEIDNVGRFLCKFCELNYSTNQTLRHHVKIKHPEEATKLKHNILNNKRNSKLKCHICKTKFKLVEDLKDHVRLRHEIENIETSCTNCDATFQSQKSMLDHLYYKHKIVKKQIFSCTICGYRTLKKSHFNQHKNTHSKNKYMKCGHCDYSTNYLPNLKIHVRLHTNNKPYSCDYEGCEYRSTAKSALRSHQLKHNREENMLYCDKCSYKTVYKQSLKKHGDSHSRNSIKVKL